MARPELLPEQRRSGWVSFRATPAEIIRINAKASTLGLSQSAFVRQRSLSEFLLPRRRQVNPHAVAVLVGLANNANQIAKHANAGRGLPIDAVLTDLFAQIYTALDKLHDPFDQHGGPDL